MALLLTEDIQPNTFLNSLHQTEDLTEKTKKKYNLINDETRKKVIEMVELNNASLKEASQTLGIKLSTCKAILQVFQKEGRFEKKKKRIRKGSNMLEKTVSHDDEESTSMKSTSLTRASSLEQDFSKVISKSIPFKVNPGNRLKKKSLFSKSKIAKNLFRARFSFEESSETKSCDSQTNYSSRNSFFKYPHVWKLKAKKSFNSCASEPKLSEETSLIEEEDRDYMNVLKGMWKEVFEFFGTQSL